MDIKDLLRADIVYGSKTLVRKYDGSKTHLTEGEMTDTLNQRMQSLETACNDLGAYQGTPDRFHNYLEEGGQRLISFGLVRTAQIKNELYVNSSGNGKAIVNVRYQDIPLNKSLLKEILTMYTKLGFKERQSVGHTSDAEFQDRITKCFGDF